MSEKIYTLLDRPKTIPCEAGRHFLNTYSEEIKHGIKSLKLTGQTNIYDKIQADLESTKIENILHAVAMGDLTALQQREVFYADVTELPKSLMEAQNMIIKMKEDFYKMPEEVRKQFDYSADKYIEMSANETEFLEKMAPYNQQLKEIKEAGSKEEYRKKVAEQAQFEKDVAAAKGGEA